MVCLGAEDRRGLLGSSNGGPEEELNRGSPSPFHNNYLLHAEQLESSSFQMLAALFLTQSCAQGKEAQFVGVCDDVPGKADQEQEKQDQMSQLWRTHPQQRPLPRYSCLHSTFLKSNPSLTQIEYLQSTR